MGQKFLSSAASLCILIFLGLHLMSKEGHAFVTECQYSDYCPYKWEKPEDDRYTKVTVRFNKGSYSESTAGLDFGRLFRESIQVWNSQGRSYFQYTDGGDTRMSSDDPLEDLHRDNRVIISVKAAYSNSDCGSLWVGCAVTKTRRSFLGIFGKHFINSCSVVISTSNKNDVSVRETTVHELGHCLGLKHSGDRNAVMAPAGGSDYLGGDDVNGIRHLYGTRVDASPGVLSREHPACNSVTRMNQPECISAVHRICSNFFGLGMGLPQEYSPPNTIGAGCFQPAAIGDVPVSVLSQFHPDCNDVSRSQTAACASAAHRYCALNGFSAGNFQIGEPQEVGRLSFRVGCHYADRLDNVPISTLRSLHSGCDSVSKSQTSQCTAAVHRYCGLYGYNMGTPQEVGVSSFLIGCWNAQVYKDFAVNSLPLHSYHGGCDSGGEAQKPECIAAIHRKCNTESLRSMGLPQEVSSTTITMGCFDAEAYGDVSIATLRNYHSACDSTSKSQTAACASAVHRFCIDEGFAAGSFSLGEPQEVGSGVLGVGCFNADLYLDVTINTLKSFHLACNSLGESQTNECTSAVHRYCAARGYNMGTPQEIGNGVFGVGCWNAPEFYEALVK